ncbi:PREDICTED: vesicle-associated membrane protein 3-like isoform X1 [Habropoda laboriosa]|uniref:vesicle-associated membrane protein 3-like isoform X1 n=1 Tax=Habropoda laboriosa TaxID=597456 RepID=UPI00083DEA11|nr:PREDICTED: vesicle-associated membrane protein 3-like isoform X1 [Habropoda laboriosa]XP_017798196.1 PREDICTED: vesicle-associated membrane protein 3-like isoform X1 [Habropoda laboriosa]
MSTTSKWDLSREDIKAAATDEKELLLEHDSDQDENMLFNRPSTSSGETQADGKMDSVRLQIQEVTEVMRENVQKVLEREERLEDLQEASERLNMAGNEFRSTAKKAQQRAWLQNFRTRIILVTMAVTIVICIIVLDITVLYLVLR